jgi:hypothetical protein
LVLAIAFLENKRIEDGMLGRKFGKEESAEESEEEGEGGIVALHLPEKV